ncbi:helix-turn-helix domain-containing protein [Levilactobacillus koreensis]|uniref:Uncharacterized protein n=1 Tax=Levilactobacillus koreensis TaxID=637971 RepID=A0AAC8UV16_9LACO|nr:helix-turn-helix transcriptional regulator [Levilactobacillus koreensis]AKP64496.1 hypothetical protein ABN16_05465 [Levilactobacillus koreensis]
MSRRKYKDPVDVLFGKYIATVRRSNFGKDGVSSEKFINSVDNDFGTADNSWISVDHWRNIEAGSTEMTLGMLLKVAEALNMDALALMKKYIEIVDDESGDEVR